MRLTEAQRTVLGQMVGSPNGWAGWTNRYFADAAKVCGPMAEAGLCEPKQFGSFQGYRITESGRRALEQRTAPKDGA